MYYLFIMRQVICWFVYIGKNPRFTAFLDSNLHTRLAIVTGNELGLAFPPRNLPKKFRPDPSTLVTNRQTYYIIPRESFGGDNNNTRLEKLPRVVAFQKQHNYSQNGNQTNEKLVRNYCRGIGFSFL